MEHILIINGPNLNMLGTREPEIYGSTTLSDINERIQKCAEEAGVAADFFQSNHEGAIVDKIQEAMGKYAYIILNAGAYTHYSVAIRDAIAAIDVPVIEVHMSNIYTREEFRHHSVIAPVAMGQISGFGAESYLAALYAAVAKLKEAGRI